MNEARTNPNAQEKAEGKRTGFSTEIESIAMVTRLAEIGLKSLVMFYKPKDDSEKSDEVEELIKCGPALIEKFSDVAHFLYEKSQEDKK